MSLEQQDVSPGKQGGHQGSPQRGSGVILQGQVRARPRGHVPLAPRGPAHGPLQFLPECHPLRVAPSPGKARLSRGPEERAEGAVWTGSAGGCRCQRSGDPARAAWCAASLMPDSGWRTARREPGVGAEELLGQPGPPGSPCLREAWCGLERWRAEPGHGPRQLPLGSGRVACSWERTPGGSRPSSAVAAVSNLWRHMGPAEAPRVPLGCTAGVFCCSPSPVWGRGCLRGEGGGPGEGLAAQAHSCSPRDLRPGALGPDAGAAPARCHLGLRAVGAQPQWSQGHSGGAGPGRPCGIQGGARGSPGWQACSREAAQAGSMPLPGGQGRCPRAGGSQLWAPGPGRPVTWLLCVSPVTTAWEPCRLLRGQAQSLSALFPDVFGVLLLLNASVN